MSKTMNSPNGAKSGVMERVSIVCPTCGTRDDLSSIITSSTFLNNTKIALVILYATIV